MPRFPKEPLPTRPPPPPSERFLFGVVSEPARPSRRHSTGSTGVKGDMVGNERWSESSLGVTLGGGVTESLHRSPTQ